MKIAALYTCYNRKTKTLASLSSLYEALRFYNAKNTDHNIELEIFLTDDGCTDGTAAAIKVQFASKIIHILSGTGNLFWAGGMRLAWRRAMTRHAEWDYYLLLNDDTILLKEAFEELMNTQTYCQKQYHLPGIYSGITCDSNDSKKITYGGDVFLNKFTGTRKRLATSDIPQICDITNANIMLVSKEVVDGIGIFYDKYVHSAADFDYTYLARKAGFPVLITAKVCGICDNDHKTEHEKEMSLKSMSLKERKIYFCNPLHSTKDYETFVKRAIPMKYPITWIFRKLNLYVPSLYYWLNGKR